MTIQGEEYDFRKILQEMRDDYWRSLEAVDDDLAAERREYVIVRIGNLRFALPATDCREVLRPPRIVAVPRAGTHIHGIINLRGEVVAVTDLRPLFALGEATPSERPQLVVVAAAGLQTALLVDRVEGMLTIAVDLIAPVATGLSGLLHDAVAGQLDDPDGNLVFLDLQRLLARSELIVDQKGSERL